MVGVFNKILNKMQPNCNFSSKVIEQKLYLLVSKYLNSQGH